MESLSEILTFSVLIPWVLGMVFGVFVGSTPGLTATMAVALLIPISYQLADPVAGLALIIGVSFTAIFAGDIPATYLRIPGTPASMAATLDSHLLAKRGRAKETLSTNLVCSAMGGVVGVASLWWFGPRLARFALRFDDYEYFWLMLLGLCLCVFVSGKRWFRGILAATLGIAFATVGLDSIGNASRYTFESTPFSSELADGLRFIPAMIGLFGLSEALRWSADRKQTIQPRREKDWPTIRLAAFNLWKHKFVFLLSSFVGTVVGALPGAGADIAAWTSYGISQRLHRGQPAMGDGSMAGVVAPTSANNAAVAGAWIPALVFGLPGDSVTAIVIGAFSVYNIQPGPDAFSESGSAINSLLWIALVTQFIMFPAGWLGIKLFGQAMKMPRSVIQCGVVVFSFVGAYAVANSVFDIWVMVAFAFLGLFFHRYRIPVTPLILGMILGKRIETHWRTGLISSQGDYGPFFERGDCQILISLIVLVLGGVISASVYRAVARRNFVDSATETEVEDDHES